MNETARPKRSPALFLENFRQAGAVIRAHRLRSSLLILGVGIGVAAILAVVTILVGLGAQIEHDMTMADRPYIMVARFDMLAEGPEGESALKRKKLEPEAAEEIASACDAVVHVDFRYDPNGRLRVIEHGGEHTQPVKVVGTGEAFPLIHGFAVAEGRFFSRTELEHRRKVIVLAWGPAKDLFPNVDPIGRTVRIGTRRYEVVGVFEERKHIMGQLGEGYAVVPFTSYERDFLSRWDESYVVVSPRPGRMEEAREQVIQTLRAHRRVPPGGENDFAVLTSEAFRDTVNRITGAIALVLVAISSIGLLVGGIGVMNIMLISVTERTHEVGLRMSVGARRSDVLLQFLVESATLTGLGGAVGVGFGIAAAHAISRVTGFPLGVSPFWVAVSVLFSALIGLIFGVFPANRAARMDPIEALRHEK